MTKIMLNNKFMYLNYMKYFFMMTLMISTMITINSSSWLNAWMGMEMNLMSFIPLMMNYSKKIKLSNSMMIYFIIQAGASSMMFTSMMMIKMEFIMLKMNFLMNMIQISLLLKLGASPFHWWMIKIINNMNWMNCFIIMTWQKIAPLMLIMITNNNNLIYLSALLSTYMGAIMGLNQSLIKLILIYSSINHLGWMLMTLNLSLNMMIIYLIIYSLINLMMCMMMNFYNFYYLNQLFKNNNQSMLIKMIMMSLFLSLGGLPPLIGFLPKFFVLILMLKSYMILEAIMFIIMTTISLSYYINPLMSMMIMLKFNSKWNNKNYNINKMMFNILMINLIFIMIIYSPMMNQII